MVGVCNDLGAQYLGSKLLNCIHYYKQLFLNSGVILLSLVKCLAHIIDDIGLLVIPLPQHSSKRMVTYITYALKCKTSLSRNMPQHTIH